MISHVTENSVIIAYPRFYKVILFRIRIMLDELELIIDSVQYEEVSVENAILQIRSDHMVHMIWMIFGG